MAPPAAPLAHLAVPLIAGLAAAVLERLAQAPGPDPLFPTPCCSPDFAPCGLNCCAVGESCLGNSTCCSKLIYVARICCATGEICVNASCCSPANVCGGQNCCRSDETCLANGTCCPTRNAVCGGICCPSPFDVCDPVTKACTLKCPDGNPPCGETCCEAGQCCAFNYDTITRQCVTPTTGPVEGHAWCGEGSLIPSVATARQGSRAHRFAMDNCARTSCTASDTLSPRNCGRILTKGE
jgi:hypothetical protein